MPMLQGKKILITGLLSDRSIAYGIAQACKREGAVLAFTYQQERFKERVTKLAGEFDSDLVLECDVSQDDSIKAMTETLSNCWDNELHGLLHSIAFTPKEGISGDFVENVDREIFSVSQDVTSYSFLALAKATREMLIKGHGSLLTLSYIGSEKVVPNYNMAGVAKASLEATMRYMAYSLGEQGVRVNAISAGPIKTLAASGISGFGQILDFVADVAPLKRGITSLEVGNVAAFLFSNLASGVTGETIYVDAGFNIMSGLSK